MVTDVSPEQKKKASLPKLQRLKTVMDKWAQTEDEYIMIDDKNYLNSPNKVYYSLIDDKYEEFNPMSVTELGMVIEVSPVQPLKAFHPMSVTELGMVTDVSPVQPRKASNLMFVTVYVLPYTSIVLGITTSPDADFPS